MDTAKLVIAGVVITGITNFQLFDSLNLLIFGAIFAFILALVGFLIPKE